MNARNGRIALLGFLLLSLAAVVGFPLTAGAQDTKLPKLIETLAVDAGDYDGTWSSQPLVAGATYELRATGTYTYGQGDSRADAECSQLLPDETWNRNRYAAMTNYRDVLDLYLDHDPVDWQPTDADSLGCNGFNNTYTHQFTMPDTRHIRLFIRDADGTYEENAGGLSVKIREIDPHAENVDGAEADDGAGAPPAATATASPAPAATRRVATPVAPVSAAPVAPVAPIAPAEVAPPAPLPSELLLNEQALQGGGQLPPLTPATSVRHELLAVLGLAAWLSVVAMVIRRFQFVVVPAGTTFYASPPPSS